MGHVTLPSGLVLPKPQSVALTFQNDPQGKKARWVVQTLLARTIGDVALTRLVGSVRIDIGSNEGEHKDDLIIWMTPAIPWEQLVKFFEEKKPATLSLIDPTKEAQCVASPYWEREDLKYRENVTYTSVVVPALPEEWLAHKSDTFDWLYRQGVVAGMLLIELKLDAQSDDWDAEAYASEEAQLSEAAKAARQAVWDRLTQTPEKLVSWVNEGFFFVSKSKIYLVVDFLAWNWRVLSTQWAQHPEVFDGTASVRLHLFRHDFTQTLLYTEETDLPEVLKAYPGPYFLPDGNFHPLAEWPDESEPVRELIAALPPMPLKTKYAFLKKVPEYPRLLRTALDLAYVIAEGVHRENWKDDSLREAVDLIRPYDVKYGWTLKPFTLERAQWQFVIGLYFQKWGRPYLALPHLREARRMGVTNINGIIDRTRLELHYLPGWQYSFKERVITFWDHFEEEAPTWQTQLRTALDNSDEVAYNQVLNAIKAALSKMLTEETVTDVILYEDGSEDGKHFTVAVSPVNNTLLAQALLYWQSAMPTTLKKDWMIEVGFPFGVIEKLPNFVKAHQWDLIHNVLMSVSDAGKGDEGEEENSEVTTSPSTDVRLVVRLFPKPNTEWPEEWTGDLSAVAHPMLLLIGDRLSDRHIADMTYRNTKVKDEAAEGLIPFGELPQVLIDRNVSPNEVSDDWTRSFIYYTYAADGQEAAERFREKPAPRVPDRGDMVEGMSYSHPLINERSGADQEVFGAMFDMGVVPAYIAIAHAPIDLDDPEACAAAKERVKTRFTTLRELGLENGTWIGWGVGQRYDYFDCLAWQPDQLMKDIQRQLPDEWLKQGVSYYTLIEGSWRKTFLPYTPEVWELVGFRVVAEGENDEDKDGDDGDIDPTDTVDEVTPVNPVSKETAGGETPPAPEGEEHETVKRIKALAERFSQSMIYNGSSGSSHNEPSSH